MVNDETAFCVNCGQVISPDSPYCTDCGVEQPTDRPSNKEGETTFLSADKEYCTNCGEVIDISVQYCGQCGSRATDDPDPNVDLRPTEWIIGLSPGSTTQNLVAGIFFYLFLYPISIPTLLYAYLLRKRQWTKRNALVTAALVAVILIAAVATV